MRLAFWRKKEKPGRASRPLVREESPVPVADQPPPPLPSEPGSVRLVMADGTVKHVRDEDLQRRMRYLADNLLPEETASESIRSWL